jgi:hypothetical protein
MPGEYEIDIIPIVTSLKNRFETNCCSEIKRIRRPLVEADAGAVADA